MKLLKSLGLAFALAAVGVLVAEAIAPTESHAAEAKKVVKKSKGRSLASLAPVREEVGQGSVMLDNERSSRPEFLSGTKKAVGPVRLTGVCRDMYGTTYYSNAHGSQYSSCLGSQGAQTGNVDTYWSAAQRQAGAGISITGR